MASLTVPDDAAEIRRRMAQIRRELHEDVQEVVAGAEAVFDWRRYIRMFPWAAVGLAFSVGYIVIPKRRRSIPRDLARQGDIADVREAIAKSQEPAESPGSEKRKKSLVGAALGMLVPLVWRVGRNYAMSYLEQWIAQQQQQYMAATGPSASPGSSASQGPGDGGYGFGPIPNPAANLSRGTGPARGRPDGPYPRGV